MQGLTIYKSSAGSGKTYTLVREYLRIVLATPTDYRHTLAITFTNKATQEMKSRIVRSLAELAEGKNNTLKADIQKLLPDVNIPVNAQTALNLILHDYSRFSISTIDSFFQRVIRSMARELHLPLRFDVEMDQDNVVDAITESLLEEAGKDAGLTRWLEELVLMKMDEDKGWKVEEDIRWVANELFTENFPLHSLDITRETLRIAIKEMRGIQRQFIQQMQQHGKEANRIIADNGLTENDFFYGKKGVQGYFKRIETTNYPNAETYIPNSYVEKTHSGTAKWYSSKTTDKKAVERIASDHLSPILNDIFSLLETSFRQFVTAQEVLKYIYIAGIVSDLSRKLGAYRDERSLVFISDAPKILSSFITADDTPFVYEKFGTTFKHFLIDEFQDTSSLQWKNLLPLIRESIGSGHLALVVGDAKQSIYRWRGGNMQLLNRIKGDLPEFPGMIAEEKLLTNYRSRKLIVDFNNEFFTHAAQLINVQLQLTDKNISTIAYHAEELNQAAAPHLQEGGFVRVKFYNSDKKSETTEAGLKWKEKALAELIITAQNLLEKGFEPRDIAILVRKNLHGNEIATNLFENGIEKVISPDSLLLLSSPKVSFLLSTLRFLCDHSDHVARAEVMYYYTRYQLHKEELHELFTQHQQGSRKTKQKEKSTQQSLFDTDQLKDDAFNHLLPEGFTQHLFYLSKLPLYELVEQLISIFHLNRNPDAYLQRFQDVVLEQTIKSNISVTTFPEWWEEHKQSFSVIVPENENAITIMTIHKSKGLQFPVVIIPWMDWTLGPNQRDLLWVTSDESPYDGLGMMPVKPTKALLKTDFKGQFEDELISNYIDNLNLMYVAMTRAEEQLYIFCENCEEGEIKNIAAIVKRTVSETSILKPLATPVEVSESHGETYEDGELKGIVRTKEKDEASHVESYIINRWQEKLSISSKAREIQQLMNSNTNKKMDFGILVHRALSEIKDKEEINVVTEKIFFEGIITNEEKERLKMKINNYFSIEGIELFYNNEWRVMNERQILLPEGEVLRPDRVLIKDKQAMVIDFKTGREESSHTKQVKRYAETLLSMGYTEAKSFLVYINEKRIVSVN